MEEKKKFLITGLSGGVFSQEFIPEDLKITAGSTFLLLEETFSVTIN